MLRRKRRRAPGWQGRGVTQGSGSSLLGVRRSEQDPRALPPRPAMQDDEEVAPGLAAWAEALRGDCEPDKQWLHRRRFLLRNAGSEPPAPGTDLDRLLAYSMVWSNHVFMGCRYSPKVMEKVLDMAEGIRGSDAPVHTLEDELVSKVKKRGISNCNEGPEEPCKRKMPEDCRTAENVPNDVKDKRDKDASQPDGLMQKQQGNDADSSVPSLRSDSPAMISGHSSGIPALGASQGSGILPLVGDKGAGIPALGLSIPALGLSIPALGAGQGSGIPALGAQAREMAPSDSGQKEITSSSSGHKEVSMGAVHRGHPNTGNYSMSQKSDPVKALPQIGSTGKYCPVEQGGSKPDTSANEISSSAVPVQLALKNTSQTSSIMVKIPRKLTAEDAKQKQTFFNKLYKTIAWKLVSVGGFSPAVNHVEILNASMDSVKANLDVDFVPLKELTDLPQNKSSQENIVCELRCKSVYLATGCGRSKENAKAVAAREALKLFLKKKVVVTICKRKYSGREVEDLVLLDEGSRPLNLPPALKNPQDLL